MRPTVMTVTMWKLTCRYMGATASETVGEADLWDPLHRVEICEDLEKGDSGQFEDEDGPLELGSNPLDWKDGKATETGCGPWRWHLDENSADFYDGLLARADLPALVRGATMEDTFDIDGPNADALAALDRAEWTLEALPDVADPDIK